MKAETDSESEEGEIEDKESDFENTDTSGKHGYCSITTSLEVELNIRLYYLQIKTKLLDGDSVKANNLIDTGGQGNINTTKVLCVKEQM